ncbi:MAG: phosphoesterase, partial [Acidobacteria bacterium]
MTKVKVLYHDNCFDGVSSAAVFSRFYKGRFDPGAVIEYEGLTHKAGQQISEDLFGPAENVIVDFKYC